MSTEIPLDIRRSDVRALLNYVAAASAGVAFCPIRRTPVASNRRAMAPAFSTAFFCERPFQPFRDRLGCRLGWPASGVCLGYMDGFAVGAEQAPVGGSEAHL